MRRRPTRRSPRRTGSDRRDDRLRVAAACLGAAALLALPVAAAAQISVADWTGGGLELAGYARTLTALHDPALDIPVLDGSSDGDETTAFAGQVVRLKWTATGGDGRWVLEVHDRLQARVTTTRAGALEGSVAGFGVSAVPERSVDLTTTLVDEERVTVWHDLDRLAFTVYTDAADVTVGRQAITWGLSTLFPVADLWSRFSPFELDTEEKPGIDAARVLAYPGDGVELDVVVADRGSLDDLSAGVRATWTLPWGDLWGGAGKLWREALVMAGAAVLLDDVKLRAEAVLPWEIDDESGDGETGLDDPRVTLGADWITGRWVVSGEVHHNGIGADDPAGYVRVLTEDSRPARGETYFLGRWYAGASAAWQAADRLSLATAALVNLTDRSAALTPTLSWDVGQSARLSAGGLVSLGGAPTLSAGVPVLDSEFGSYGSLGWTRLSVYF